MVRESFLEEVVCKLRPNMQVQVKHEGGLSMDCDGFSMGQAMEGGRECYQKSQLVVNIHETEDMLFKLTEIPSDL